MVLRKQFPKSLRAESPQTSSRQSQDLPERPEESHRPGQESRSRSSSERRVCGPNKQYNKEIGGRERQDSQRTQRRGQTVQLRRPDESARHRNSSHPRGKASQSRGI